MGSLSGVRKRIEPLWRKICGDSPSCPLRTVLSRLNLRTLGVYPPTLQIEICEQDERRHKLRFNHLHEAWFPREAAITAEMWTEYLAVFWEHPSNGHRYLAGGTPIQKGDICLDCGACEGFFALQALEAGAAKVVCIEASKEMAECLERTLAREIAEGRVVICNVVVGAVEGMANFSFEISSPFSGHLHAPSASTQVRMTTIAQLCQELSLPHVDFIKMDIEGAEIQAVEGALPLLRSVHPKLAITTYHRSFDYAALRAMLRDAGYRMINPSGATYFGAGDGHNGNILRPVMLHAWS